MGTEIFGSRLRVAVRAEVLAERDAFVGMHAVRQPPTAIPDDFAHVGVCDICAFCDSFQELSLHDAALRGIRVRSYELHELIDVARVLRRYERDEQHAIVRDVAGATSPKEQAVRARVEHELFPVHGFLLSLLILFLYTIKKVAIGQNRNLWTCDVHNLNMRLHDIAFFAALFFLCGILLASVAGSIPLRLAISGGAATFVAVAAFALDRPVIAMLATVIFFGGLYHVGYEAVQMREKITYGVPVTIEGAVRRVNMSPTRQMVDVGNIRMTFARYPEYRYGQMLRAEGIIKAPDDIFRNRYLRDGIIGTMQFPEVPILGDDGGSAIIKTLMRLKDRIEETFAATLPQNEAALLAGLTLGTTSGFSKAFRTELSQSGTAHLVALSGYNIMVIVLGLGWLFRRARLRRFSFPLIVAAIMLFVLMTGAEASVVRAALMGSIMLLAGEIGRLYSFRNAITLAAFAMALQNPKVLAFDIGFALSFAALLGIVYLEPVLARLLYLDARGALLDLRKSVTMSLAATLVTLPILVVNFGTFSLSGIVANVALLVVVPWTMFLGLCIAISGAIALPLAKLFALIAHPLLWYEGSMIKFFSGFGYVDGITGLGLGFLVVYYVALIGGAMFVWRRQRYVELFETKGVQ